MKVGRFNLYLACTIFVLSVAPLTASFFLLEEVLKSAIGLGVNQDIKVILEDYREDLKQLKALNPEAESIYKRRFDAVNDQLLVHESPDKITKAFKNAYMTYYGILFGLIVVASLLVSVFLGGKLSRSYDRLIERDLAKEKRLQQLARFEEWREIARKLAHEIKNTLTPVEIKVGSLARSYTKFDRDQFAAELQSTRATVDSEIGKLKQMVEHFGRFSKLPAPELKPRKLADYIDEFVQGYKDIWPTVVFTTDFGADTLTVKLDSLLFNQCFINIINNAVEANPRKNPLDVSIVCRVPHDDTVEIDIHNNGAGIKPEISDDIFKLYYTTKKSDDNLGLGLPIVKKIVLDHGGDIEVLPARTGASFRITLPLSRKSQ